MKKETKRKLEDAAFYAVGPPMISGLLRALRLCTRIRWLHLDRFRAMLDGKRPIIFVFWHEDMVGTIHTHLSQHVRNLAVMVSHSRDGEKLVRVLARLGMTPIRGSSSRGAVGGVVELLRYLKQGPQPPEGSKPGQSRACALALDGPRGPRRVVKPGFALLARKAGALVLPLAYHPSRAIVFRSWDRTKLPLPLSLLRIHAGPILDIADWAGDDNSFAAMVQGELDRLHAELEAKGKA